MHTKKGREKSAKMSWIAHTLHVKCAKACPHGLLNAHSYNGKNIVPNLFVLMYNVV